MAVHLQGLKALHVLYFDPRQSSDLTLDHILNNFNLVPVLISHNIKNTCLILHRTPQCCQNSSGASRLGLHKTSERVLWFLAKRHWQQILQVMKVAGWNLHGSDLLVQHIL